MTECASTLEHPTPREAPREGDRGAGRATSTIRWLGRSGAIVVAGLALMAPSSFSAGQFGPTTAYAQTVGAPSVAVVGEGTARAQPDAATVRLGVQVTAPSPAEALAQTRQATDRLLEQLRGLGVQDADVQTTNLNVYPITGPGRDGTPPDPTQVSGYRGTATVVVQNQDLAKVSPLLEGAVQAGVTSVQGVTFGFRDAARLHREALGLAIGSARQQAESSATAAGMRLGGVRTVQELDGNVPGPVIQGAGLGGGGGAGGIAPGEIAVTARVQVTFDATV